MFKVRMLVLFPVVALLTGCATFGLGKVVTQEEAFTGFDRVEVDNAFKVDITQSGTYSVVVRVDSSLEQRLEVVKEGNTLKIGLKDEGGGVKIQAGTKEVEITMPELTGLDLSGASQGTITGFKSTKTLDVGLQGASEVTMSGSGQNVMVVAEGASTVDLTNFSVVDANVEARGKSQVIVNVSGRLDADASGDSNVYYLGDPTMGEIDTSGGSSVEPK